MQLKINLNIFYGTIEEIQASLSLLTQTLCRELVAEGEESPTYQQLKQHGSITLTNGAKENLMIVALQTPAEYTDFSNLFRDCAKIKKDDELIDIADAMDDLVIKDLHDLKGAIILAKSKVKEINGES